MSALIETASYVPHGYCLFWQPWLVALYAGSDLLIFLSYSAIPIALLTFLKRRPDIRFRGLVALFASFIMLCGLTHLVSILTLWVPVYPLHGALKLLTGMVSATTAVVLFGLVSKLVAIPSPQQLEEANARLKAEVAAHKETLASLREVHAEMEAKIASRTADLIAANDNLELVSREAIHRSANMFSVILALARETARGKQDFGSFLESFTGRVRALAQATGALTASTSSRAFSVISDIFHQQLEPIIETYGDRVVLEGPRIEVDIEAAQQLTLAVHELATNAVKYGALAGPCGRVSLTWGVTGSPAELILVWKETGAVSQDQVAAANSGTGFGTKLLTIAVPGNLQGSAFRRIEPQGLLYELRVRLAQISPSHRDRGGDGPDNLRT